MTLCINPLCTNPHNSDEDHFCQACGSELLLQFRYRVIKEIGKGGFGQTYEVKEGNASKVLKVLVNTSAKAVELFKREAEVLKQLNQPGIPKVEADGYFTFTPRGSQQPLHCLVMEKIVGLNLWDYIRELGRPIDGDTAKRWLSELIIILQPVHERGILHRDIKPQNIIFKTDGRLALIDFGAIKEEQDTEVATEASRGTEGTELATGTRGKTSIQSPGYTPNEQMNGQAILPQSDFYALGRTFIYLLTGRGPKNIDYDPLNDKLNWQQYAPNVSPQLADLIDQMSATLVRDRPRSSQEVLQQLNSLKPSSNSHTECTKSDNLVVTAAPESNPAQSSNSSNEFFGVVEQNKKENIYSYQNSQNNADSDKAGAYARQGGIFYSQGKLDEAIAQYRQVIQIDPNYPRAYYDLGVALYGQSKLDEAITQYRQAIQIDPNYPRAYYNLGVALYDQGKLDEAITQYRQAIQLNPKLAIAYNSLGVALHDQGKLDEAITQYRQAIQLNPTFATAYNNLGVALENQDKTREANEAYQRAKQLGYKRKKFLGLF